MKKIVLILVFISLGISLGINIFALKNYSWEIKKVESQKTKTLSLSLEDHYYISPNDIILGQFALKTGIFAFDNTTTFDGIYNKNWLPIAYNYCQTIKKDSYLKSNDFDGDNIPDINDKFPYDYSNGDYSMRSSTTLDFDKDWIPNAYDKDADGNGVLDLYQAICFGKMEEGYDKQFYSEKYKSIFVDRKDDIKETIRTEIGNFISTYKLASDISEEKMTETIENIYSSLLYKENIFLDIGGKYLLINRDKILNPD